MFETSPIYSKLLWITTVSSLITFGIKPVALAGRGINLAVAMSAGGNAILHFVVIPHVRYEDHFVNARPFENGCCFNFAKHFVDYTLKEMPTLLIITTLTWQ